MSLKTDEYLVGFAVSELDRAEELLEKTGWSWEKVKVGEALKKHIDECIEAEYKNPSSMREDAPNFFSCSSLVSYLYIFAGVWMPSLSVDKYVYGEVIEREGLKFGDLVFSNTHNGVVRYETVEWQTGTKVPEGVDHVSFYLGEGKVMHATKRSGKVVVESLEEIQKYAPVVGYRRMAGMEEERYVVRVPAKLNIKNSKDLLHYLTIAP